MGRTLLAAAALLLLSGCGPTAPPVPPAAPPSPQPPPLRDGVMACESILTRFSRPVCSVPIPDAVSRRRDLSLSLTVKGGLAEKAERRNGSGGFSPWNGISTIEYQLEEGKVRRIRSRHADGHLVLQTVYAEGGLRLYQDAAGHPRREEGSDATRARVTEDANGFELERRYFDESGKKVRGTTGTHMIRYLRDKEGQVQETQVFDENERPMLSNEGWHREKRELGAFGCVVLRTVFGLRGEPVLDSEGRSGVRRVCDDAGMQTRVDYLGVDGRPSVDKFGHAGFAVRRDEHGNSLEWTTLGLDGKPALGASDHAIERRRFDAAGRIVEQSYFGSTGAPVTRSAGYSRIASVYDEQDHVIEVRYLDANGAPLVAPWVGYAIRRIAYDRRGRTALVATFDDAGRPKKDRGGASVRAFSYDESDRVIEQRLLHAGSPVDGRDGWAKETIAFAGEPPVETRRYFRAGGEEVELLGAKSIMIAFAGAKGTVGSIRTKDEARKLAEEARRRLVAGERIQDVARELDDRRSSDTERLARGVRFAEIDAALDRTAIDGITEVVETENGYFVMQRIR